MTSSTVPQQGGSFDPVAFSLPFIAQILSGNRGLQGDTLLQQCSSLVSEGIAEYVRQVTAGNQPINGEKLTKPANSFESVMSFNAEVKTSTVDGKFTVSIPLGPDVKPADLSVVIKDRDLIVDAKIESKSEDGLTRLYKEITKKITLPEDAKAEQLKTALSPEGVLKIEAPLRNAALARAEAIQIPVKMELD